MRVHHLAMRTVDVARLERFYVDALGLAVARRDVARGSVWLRAGSAMLMIERATGGEPRVPHGAMDLVAFAIDDRTTWRAHLSAAGVAIESETEHTLYFRDPDGRRVAVSTHPLGSRRARARRK